MVTVGGFDVHDLDFLNSYVFRNESSPDRAKCMKLCFHYVIIITT